MLHCLKTEVWHNTMFIFIVIYKTSCFELLISRKNQSQSIFFLNFILKSIVRHCTCIIYLSRKAKIVIYVHKDMHHYVEYIENFNNWQTNLLKICSNLGDDVSYKISWYFTAFCWTQTDDIFTFFIWNIQQCVYRWSHMYFFSKIININSKHQHIPYNHIWLGIQIFNKNGQNLLVSFPLVTLFLWQLLLK